MTQTERLKKAIELLQAISDNWVEGQLEQYPEELGDFTELVAMLNSVKFTEA